MLLPVLAQLVYGIEGRVLDQFGLGVPGAKIEFVSQENPSVKYVSVTDSLGHYLIDLPLVTFEGKGIFRCSDFYPNPFSSSTVVHFFLLEEAHVTARVVNLSGATLCLLEDRKLPVGLHSLTWDGKNQKGSGLDPGLYLVYFRVNGEQAVKKLVFQPYGSTGEPGPFNTELAENVVPVVYTVAVSRDDLDTLILENQSFDTGHAYDFPVRRHVPVPYATTASHLGKYNGRDYDPFFIRGTNLGATIPGSLPGEVAITREQYRNWLGQISASGFNTLRIYTLHYPRFYEEFLAFNQQHPDNPLYLLQGVWLEEEVPGLDFYNLTAFFDQEIKEVVDCVHGNGDIQPRFGKAFGEFTADVSDWVLGYIIGREIHPDEVLTTNDLHPGQTAFHGQVFSMDNGSPTEVWIAARLETLVSYERTHYKKERPVSFSSWPTMDPLHHPTELPTETQEDVASFDLAKLARVQAPGGYFASYHAYPYYPDFISEDPGYQTYSDASGPNSYLGYLNDLRSHYEGMPLIIGEFGVPSSWGNAHFSFSGMHHGGHDEQTQGEYFVRQLQNIYNAGCGGAVLFAWMDEWFKNTWITEPFDSDPERRPFWLNLMGPEQNFGLIAFEPEVPDFSMWEPVTGGCAISSAKAAVNREYFHLRVTFDGSPQPFDKITVAFDTYRADLGESLLPDGTFLNNRAEFYLEISMADYARLYVTEAYDLFGIWHRVAGPQQLFRSVPSDGQPWMPVRWKNNRYEDAIFPAGELQFGSGDTWLSSRDAAVLDGNTLEVRIPWSLLQFTDPCCREVMDDDRDTPEREVTPSDGIALTLVYQGCTVETPRFVWEPWEVFPETTEREKASLAPVREALLAFPGL